MSVCEDGQIDADLFVALARTILRWQLFLSSLLPPLSTSPLQFHLVPLALALFGAFAPGRFSALARCAPWRLLGMTSPLPKLFLMSIIDICGEPLGGASAQARGRRC